jgi:protein transport protein YIF1
LRSPPPPQPQSQPQQQQQQQQGYGAYPQQAGGAAGGGFMHTPFGGFMNDPTAQMGFQVGKSAVMAGHEYMEQNVGSLFVIAKSMNTEQRLMMKMYSSTATSTSRP